MSWSTLPGYEELDEGFESIKNYYYMLIRIWHSWKPVTSFTMVAILDCSVILDLSRLNCFLKIFNLRLGGPSSFFLREERGKSSSFFPFACPPNFALPRKKRPDRRLNKCYVISLYRHECFTGKHTPRKIHKNYIRDPSGLFSIISHMSLSMT